MKLWNVKTILVYFQASGKKCHLPNLQCYESNCIVYPVVPKPPATKILPPIVFIEKEDRSRYIGGASTQSFGTFL